MNSSDPPLTLHAALFRIAEETATAKDLTSFYAAMHSIVAQLMFAANFYIALFEPHTNIITFPYYVDEHDLPPPPRPRGRGLTEYVLRTGQAHLITADDFRALRTQGEVDLMQTLAVDWLGVPLKAGDVTLGVLAVQSYSEAVRFNQQDKELLTFVSYHIATALSRKRSQEALRASEEKYRHLFEQAPIGIYRTTPDGRILDANPALVEMLGFESLAQLTERNLQTSGFEDPGERARFAALVLRNGELRDHQTTWLRRNGSSLHVREHARAIYGPNGELRYFEGTVEDVSERRKAQESLRIFQRAIEQSPVTIMLADTAGNIEYVNPKFTQVTGYAPEEVVGHNPRLLKSGETSPHEYARLWQQISTGGEWRGEFHNRRKDGTLFWEAAFISAVTDATGKVTHYLAIKEDITVRKAVESVMRQQHEFVEVLREVVTAINSTLDLNEVLDRILSNISRVVPHDAGRIMLIENGYARVARTFGASQHLFNLETHWSPMPVSVTRNLRTVFETGRPLIIADIAAYPGWIERNVLTDMRANLTAPIRSRRGIIGFLGLDSVQPGFFDETHADRLLALADQIAIAIDNAQLYERVRAHAADLEARVAERTAELQAANVKLQELDHLKSKFVANVSHELRTPLANVKLYLELLETGHADKQSHYLATLHREASLLQRLIEELLDLSRLELGSRPLAAVPLDINLLIQRLLTDRRALIAHRGLHLQTNLTPDLPTLLADQTMIAQVLTNLLTNAVNYTPKGGIITVNTAIRTALEQDWLTFSVADTGPGIPVKDQAHIFDRFYRGESSRNGAVPGTGLGLAICQEILRRHQGHITLDTESGRGSTFTAWLPMGKPRHDQETSAGQTNDVPLAVESLRL